MTKLTRDESVRHPSLGPAASRGWSWTWQRCDRYKYRKYLVHSTSLDGLVPHVPSPTNVPPLLIATRYAGGRLGARRG